MTTATIPAAVVRRTAGILAAIVATAAITPPATAHDAPPAGHAKAAELGTGAAFDRHGVLWVAIKEKDRDGGEFVVLKRTADLGKTWSPGRRVNDRPEPVTARGEARPHIAFGPQGDLYVTYTSTIARPHVGNIRFARSLDGGRSFSRPVTVQKNADAVTHSFDSLLVDRSGRVVVAWIDGRDASAGRARKAPYAGSAVYYAVSTDRGASFPADFKLADHSCECCRIALALHPAAGPVAFWRHIFEPNVRDHAIAVLDTGGKPSELTRATFDEWRIDACPHHGPSLAFSPDGRRHQVWFDGSPSGGARYAVASAGGVLGRPVALGGAQASHPDIAVQEKRIAMVWQEFDGEATAVEARWSDDDGQSWQTGRLARTTGEADKPHLVAGPEQIVLVWRTQDEGIRIIPVTGERP